MDTKHGGSASSPGAKEIALLVAAARQGDRDAFAELYGRYHGYVVTCFMSTGVSYDDSWDLAQETFLHALRGLHTLDVTRELRFGGWLATIARNVAQRRIRRLGPQNVSSLHEDDFPALEIDECAATGTQTFPWLMHCLEALPTSQRRIVLNKYILERANRQVAKVVGMSEATVRNRLKSALARLRSCLESHGVNFS